MKIKSKRPEMDLSKEAMTGIKKTIDDQLSSSWLSACKDLERFKKVSQEQLAHHNQLFKEMADRFQSWEETLLLIYHNIKKNQFLYSHYPDEWAKKYSDIKQGLRDENEALDERKITAG